MTMNSSSGDAELTRTAFPHSEIPGSKLVCSSPRLIAADHVFHRLSAPRHPPYTLSSLTTEAGIPRGLLLPRACPFQAANCRNEASVIGSRVSFHVDHSMWKASVTLLSRDLKTLTSLGLFRAPIQYFKDPGAGTVADAASARRHSQGE